MADTYEAFYNGKPLNPNRGLPTMTYAQAEDCGLTESERLWCRTDGEDTPVTADDIPYDSNNSVKDKIDTKAEIKTKTISVTTNASGVATLDSLDSQEHILSIYVQDRLAIHFWVGSGHANWVKVLNWSTMGVTAETVSVTYTYI